MSDVSIFYAVNDQGTIIDSEMGVGNHPLHVLVNKIIRLQSLSTPVNSVYIITDRHHRMLGTVNKQSYYSAEWEWPEGTKH